VEMESGGAIAWVAAAVVAWRARLLIGRRRRRERPGAGAIRLSQPLVQSCGLRPGEANIQLSFVFI
jgi:hypothetical protein